MSDDHMRPVTLRRRLLVECTVSDEERKSRDAVMEKREHGNIRIDYSYQSYHYNVLL